MPTYQYRCTDCSAEHEAVQRFTDDPLTDCPACDGNLRKVYSAVGVVFKGSGFYATDSRASSSSSSSSSSASKAEKASSKSPTADTGSATSAASGSGGTTGSGAGASPAA